MVLRSHQPLIQPSGNLGFHPLQPCSRRLRRCRSRPSLTFAYHLPMTSLVACVLARQQHGVSQLGHSHCSRHVLCERRLWAFGLLMCGVLVMGFAQTPSVLCNSVCFPLLSKSPEHGSSAKSPACHSNEKNMLDVDLGPRAGIAAWKTFVIRLTRARARSMSSCICAKLKSGPRRLVT